MLAGHSFARNYGERAGAVCFPGNVGRNGEALAYSVAAGEVQDLKILLCKRDHVGKLGPGKTYAGHIARTVNRIRSAERLLVEPLGPIIRIIVDSNGTAARSNVDMMGQREIAKAKIARDLTQCTGKLGFRSQSSNVSDKPLYSIEHPPRRLRRGEVFQVTPVPKRFFPRARALRSSMSECLSAAPERTWP